MPPSEAVGNVTAGVWQSPESMAHNWGHGISENPDWGCGLRISVHHLSGWLGSGNLRFGKWAGVCGPLVHLHKKSSGIREIMLVCRRVSGAEGKSPFFGWLWERPHRVEVKALCGLGQVSQPQFPLLYTGDDDNSVNLFRLLKGLRVLRLLKQACVLL